MTAKYALREHFFWKKRVSFKIEKKIASNNKNMRTCDMVSVDLCSMGSERVKWNEMYMRRPEMNAQQRRNWTVHKNWKWKWAVSFSTTVTLVTTSQLLFTLDFYTFETMFNSQFPNYMFVYRYIVSKIYFYMTGKIASWMFDHTRDETKKNHTKFVFVLFQLAKTAGYIVNTTRSEQICF